MSPDARVAVYYAPRPEDPLFATASAWLGRDAEGGARVPQPDVPDLAALTAEPRVYGFHATLKPPMRLAEGHTWEALLQAARDLAERTAAFALPALAVRDLHGFLALRETEPCPPLQALADDCVATLDRFRTQPSVAELERRRRGGLTPQQDAMLVRWGYPYVFETWFFHMTLTRRLSGDEKALVQPKAERHFAPALRVPRRVEDICLFTQSAPGADFVLAERLSLRG